MANCNFCGNFTGDNGPSVCSRCSRWITIGIGLIIVWLLFKAPRPIRVIAWIGVLSGIFALIILQPFDHHQNRAPQEKHQIAKGDILAPTPALEVRRAEPITSKSSDTAILAEPTALILPLPATPVFTPGATREITVRVTKKIRVRIVHDNPKGSSDYLGFMTPVMGPRTFRGKYFWIKATDPEALQVTINGQPAGDPESGVEIARNPDL